MTTANPPSSEQLALSASVFTNSIDSWLPKTFGPKQGNIDRDADFAKRLREAARQGENERLGLGHPDIGVHKARGPSLSALQKKLGKVDRKGSQKQVQAQITRPSPDDSDEEESRSKSLSSKKRSRGVQDLLLGKKKKATVPAVHPVLSPVPNLESHKPRTSVEPVASAASAAKAAKAAPTPPSQAPPQTKPPRSDANAQTDTSTQPLCLPQPGAQPETDLLFRGQGLPSPQTKKTLNGPTHKRPREDSPALLNLTPKMDNPAVSHDDDESPDEEGGGKEMSKSQRRREARKRAKRVKRAV